MDKNKNKTKKKDLKSPKQEKNHKIDVDTTGNSKNNKKNNNDEKNLTTLQRTETACKLIATTIIVISATFHFYRLFRYGMILF